MIQEIKTEEKNFPYNDFKNLGYESHVFGQKSYNGVAFLSKVNIKKINTNFFKDKNKQSRILVGEINFSKKAVERINQLIAKKPSGTFFRIAVKGGGCSGFKYDFSFDSKIDNDDIKQENIVIDKSSLDMLKGSDVDFSEELIGNSFKISNTKTKSSCGCGISFSF